ncbi:hypothetical protein CLPU_2c00660 [Gottschalkia purinilytica]|uniref:Uncharacterized protein n=1 Tax=Gottschalkia purinilytica TaxID=1503 RepID=A0A0L0WDX0_GOTPU|nr:hypothetical protein [Gottschalkia purinilytica]KNF09615.1 hypothetical protein CLPU_2c00660 [Gottschalkia purinilytica]
MASMEQLRKVAARCSEHQFRNEWELRATVGLPEESCVNCIHLKDYKCELDLTDEILSNMSMELEDKE